MKDDAPLDNVSPADEQSRQIQRTLDGPRCYTNPLARLMASAQGAILLDGTRTDAERLKLIRRKARRAKELRAALTVSRETYVYYNGNG